MIRSDETFEGTFPFAPHFSDAAGFRMHYVDEGPRDGEVVLCLHGEPTWSYFFRHLIAALRGSYRVIAPDHMGFGKSETPADRSYWLQDHIDNLERLVLALDLRGITLVLHDFGSLAGMGLAARHPERIARVISTNGPVPFGQADLIQRIEANAAVSPWFSLLGKAEAAGALELLLDSACTDMPHLMALNGYDARRTPVDRAWINAYQAHFVEPSDNRGVIGWAKGFVIGKHRPETPDAEALRWIRSRPALAIWGEADRTLHAEHFLPLFTALFPHAPVHRLAGVGHFCHEEAPAELAALISAFLRQG